MKEQRISVVINTYNAERHLREVLETVKHFDEIVVCDMESTDQTISVTFSFVSLFEKVWSGLLISIPFLGFKVVWNGLTSVASRKDIDR